MTRKQQSTLEASGIEWPAWRIYVPCMAHVIQLAIGGFKCSLGVKGRTKSCEGHERDQQFGENECIDIGMSQRLRKEGNSKINKVSAMRPDLVKIIEIVCISRHFENPETDLHIAENGCCIDYTDTESSKQDNWLSNSQCLYRDTTYYACEDTFPFDTGADWASQPIVRIHSLVASESALWWLLATIHNMGWIDHRQLCFESFVVIPTLDPVDVEEVYSYIASCNHCLKWHVQSSGWWYVNFCYNENLKEGRLVLHREVCATEGFQISC